MNEIEELLDKRAELYSQIRKINEQVEEYYSDDSKIKVGDLFYDSEDFYYLVIEKHKTSVAVLSYCKDLSSLEINTSYLAYVELLNYTKVTSDYNAFENLTSKLLHIKNGKEL